MEDKKKLRVKTGIRQERLLRGWSQQALADQLGSTIVTINRWERGAQQPSAYFRVKLCALFGKSVEELGFSLDDPLPSHKQHVQRAQPAPIPTSASSPVSAMFDFTLPVLLGAQSFIGRDQVLAQIMTHLFTSHTVALSALNGLPGVGKTTLALHVAYDPHVREHFCDGLLWASLGPTPNVQSILSHWGTLLGISENEARNLTDQQAWGRRLRAVIGLRRFLLVLDDVWQVETALACQIGGPHCGTLLTTRLPQVALALSAQETVTVEELNEEQSLALLTQLAPEVIRYEPELVRVLLQAAGGLPLALTLIGNYLRVQAHNRQPRRIRGAIERLLDTTQRMQLQEPRSLVDERSIQRTGRISLQAVIEVSDQQLNERTQRMLRALSVFPAKPTSFSEEAALQVSGQTMEELDALSDAGLLESAGATRYMLHQTIVDYGRLHRSDSTPVQQLIAYSVAYLKTHSKDYSSLELERDVLLLALDEAFANGQQADGMCGVLSFIPFLLVRGLYEDAERLLLQAQKAASYLKDPNKQVEILHFLWEITDRRGLFEQAKGYASKGLQLACQEHNTEQKCLLLIDAAEVARNCAEYTEAERYIQEARAMMHQPTHQKEFCRLLGIQGSIAYHRGNYELAETFYQEGVLLARQRGEQDRLCSLLRDLGVVATEQGNGEKAERYLQEAFHLALSLGDRVHLMLISKSRGVNAMFLGHFEHAKISLLEGISFARQIGDPNELSGLLTNLGSTFASQKNYPEATRCFQEALDIAGQVKNPRRISFLMLNLGMMENEQGKNEQAEIYLQEALNVARGADIPVAVSRALAAFGEYYLRLQRIEASEDVFQQMLISTPKANQELRGIALYGLARVALLQQRRTEARRLGEQSIAILKSIRHHETKRVEQWLERETNDRDL